MAQKRRHSPPPQEVYSSDTIYDRSSTFTALYSPTLTARALQASPSVSTATHRVAAWRIPSKQTTISLSKFSSAGTAMSTTQLYDTGHDSDGEKGAGRRLEKVLSEEGAEGSLVVGRWYGGVMLGPVRFTHIEKVAREAVRSARGGGGGDPSSLSSAAALKRARIISPRPGTPAAMNKTQAADAAKLVSDQKAEVINELRDRDSSIGVLRKLLEDKKALLEGRKAASTPPRTLNYSNLPYPSLKALGKVRDATIAFLLKELDKVEHAQSTEDEVNATYMAREEEMQQRQQQPQDTETTVEMGAGEESEEDITKRMERKRRRMDEFEEEDRQAWDMLDEARRHIR